MRKKIIDKIRRLGPYLASGESLKYHWVYLLFEFNIAVEIFLGLLVGIGAGGSALRPFLAAARLPPAPGPGAPAPPALQGLADRLAWPIFLLLLIWVVLRAILIWVDGSRRGLLARDVRRKLRAEAYRIERALAKTTQREILTELDQVDLRIAQIVDRAIEDGVWPWSGPNPSPRVKKRAEAVAGRFLPEEPPGPLLPPPPTQMPPE